MPHPAPVRRDRHDGVAPPSDPPTGALPPPAATAREHGDAGVLGRRALHRAAAAGCARWLPPLHVAFAVAGGLLVLLPAVSPSWRALIERVPPLGALSADYAVLGASARIHLAILFAAWVARMAATVGPSADGARPPGFDEIVARNLYPRTRREELAFWIDVVQAFAATSLWLLMPFGVLAAIAGTLRA